MFGGLTHHRHGAQVNHLFYACLQSGLHHAACAFHIGLLKFLRPGMPHRVQVCQMKKPIAALHGIPQGCTIGQIGNDDFRPQRA
jgi:hypothetical protein